MGLATLQDVKRVLHRDQFDDSIDAELTEALANAEYHVKLYLKQDFAQLKQSTYTIYDRPEDAKIPVPVIGSDVNEVRLYRTPTATPYVGTPLVDYEVQHDGLNPPFSVRAQAQPGGAFAAGAYYWVVTAVNPAGETNGSFETAATVANGQAARLSWGAYGGEKSFKVYRVAVSGTESVNASCLVASVPAVTTPQPDQSGGPTSFSYTDTGAATSAGSAPVNNGTVTVPARWIRLHPTYFDTPFEGAVSMHLPDNWSRIEVDYTPPQTAPRTLRDAVALTAAACYVRGPLTASAFTSESMGGYSYSVRPLRGMGTGSNEIIPEVAKAMLRPLKRRRAMVV